MVSCSVARSGLILHRVCHVRERHAPAAPERLSVRPLVHLRGAAEIVDRRGRQTHVVGCVQQIVRHVSGTGKHALLPARKVTGCRS